MKTRVRTAWQRTPKIIREAVDEGQSLISDQAKTIERLRQEADQLRADGRNLLVQRDTAQRALTLLWKVEKLDVVITPPGDGLTTYYAITSRNQIMPIFGVMPGDKILVSRKKVL